jgi:phosphoribosylanthranilate isomerase
VIPVKICGISNIESLKLVLNYPISAIGFIFYEKSPRYISPESALELIQFIPNNIKKIGVFVNESIEKINQIQSMLQLDFLQFHGDENQHFINQFETPIIKALRVNNNFNLKKLEQFNVHSLLLDTYQPGLFGGTGESFNWDILNKIKLNTPVILSGGLNPNNIKEALKLKNIDAMDVNSGVEKCPGEKDNHKLSELFLHINSKPSLNIFNEI